MKVTSQDGSVVDVLEADDAFARFKQARDAWTTAMFAFHTATTAGDRSAMNVAIAEAEAAASHCESTLREIANILTSKGFDPAIGKMLTDEMGRPIHEATSQLRRALGTVDSN